MDVSLGYENFALNIQQLPIDGKDIVLVIEAAKLTVDVVKEIGNAIMALAKELGVIIPNMEVDELGVRALLALEKGIYPYSYPFAEEWVNKIMQDDWGYDLSISEQMNKEEKIYAGIGTVAAYIVDKFEQSPIKEVILLAAFNPGLFKIEKMKGLASIILNGGKNLETVIGYLSGKDKSRRTIEKATDILVDLEKSIDSAIDENEAYKRVIAYNL